MRKWIFGPALASRADKLGTYAAALAYCFVLSIIPFLVVTFVLATAVTHLDLVDSYSNLLTDILPNQPVQTLTGVKAHPDANLQVKHEKVAQLSHLSGQIIRTMETSSHRGLASLGFVLAIYTSYNLMTQIVRTLLFIFDDPRKQDWTPTVTIKTLTLLAIWTVLLLLLAFFFVLTPVVEGLLERWRLNPRLWTNPLLWGRDVVGFAALFGAFFLTYLLVPAKRYKLWQVRNGSLVATTGWILCSLLFAKIVPNMWRANAVYEALGSIVIILLWAQACAWMVILGACWIVRFPGQRGR